MNLDLVNFIKVANVGQHMTWDYFVTLYYVLSLCMRLLLRVGAHTSIFLLEGAHLLHGRGALVAACYVSFDTPFIIVKVTP